MSRKRHLGIGRTLLMAVSAPVILLPLLPFLAVMAVLSPVLLLSHYGIRAWSEFLGGVKP
jgi:hypothetical protein